MTTLQFILQEPVTISLNGSGGGYNFTTRLELSGSPVLYEVDETLISVPIDFTRQLSPGMYWLNIASYTFLDVELDSSGTVGDSADGFLELTVEFN